MPQGWYGLICCICFKTLTPETCAVDAEGQLWDTCRGICAEQTGLEEITYEQDVPPEDLEGLGGARR